MKLKERKMISTREESKLKSKGDFKGREMFSTHTALQQKLYKLIISLQ